MADEDGGEVSEGLEMFGFAFVAAREAAVVGEPGQACLDDPPVPAKALRGLDAFAGDTHHDATAADLGPDRLVVVGLVRVQLRGPVTGTATPGSHRCEGVQQREQQLRVWRVRSGDQHLQRHPTSIAQDMDLRARFAAVDRVWPGQVPF